MPLSPALIDVAPGDAIRLSGGPDGIYLVTRIEEGEVRQLEARRHEPAALLRQASAVPLRAATVDVSSGFAPVLHLIDLPRYAAGDATTFARAAAFASPWRRILLSSSTTTEAYRSRASLEKPASIGVLTAPLATSVSGRFDRVGVLEADIFFGGLSSVDEDSVLNGSNRLAVKSLNGSWEVIGFARAEETAPGHWRLSQLLRGLAGTEDCMAAGADAGSEVVVLNDAVVSLGISTQERGLALNWLAESVGSSGGRYGPIVFAGGTRAETPLAPVHLKARRFGADTLFSWVRRGRVDAGDWDAFEIPLDEPEERYRIELMAGNTTVRASDVAGPSFTYAADMEAVDFGGPQTAFRVRLRQLGRAVPLGIPAIFDVEPS
jgi:hypothetical protein